VPQVPVAGDAIVDDDSDDGDNDGARLFAGAAVAVSVPSSGQHRRCQPASVQSLSAR